VLIVCGILHERGLRLEKAEREDCEFRFCGAVKARGLHHCGTAVCRGRREVKIELREVEIELRVYCFA
jgi:hypothetical protein